MSSFDRRDFLKTVSATGLTLSAAGSAFASRGSKMTGGRVGGANDRINIGVIGVGGPGKSDRRNFARFRRHKQARPNVRVGGLYKKSTPPAGPHFQSVGARHF